MITTIAAIISFAAGAWLGYWKRGADTRHREKEAAARRQWSERQINDGI